ncbi:hypothetical protein O8C94_04145 [Aliarcobacter butzleri]|uniref:hypothetical protein n=1 Tax=Aliarcobacter butzleri TaxID=28197 RepID=UPI0021B2D43B|nr:hypothetical protein [Aliarcobacter butzleri]MDN5067968.1 hypothetical protein [Aliarcobacter butzleri]UXC30121.1 hypothetical protein N3114_03705 [Aliarcobacter butzleri]
MDRDIVNDPNASVYKIDNYNYEIIIGKKLLALLNFYATQIVNDILIFSKIDRIEENTEKLHKICNVIFFFWTQFIILHEWAHIMNGHLELKIFSDPYYEFNANIKANNESDIFLEMDADKLAGQFLINQFLIILNDLEIELQEDKITLIENFYKIMYHLFDMFFRIYGKNIRTSHPSIFDRIHAISTIFGEQLIARKDLLKMSEEKLEEIGNKSIFEFTIYLENYNLDKSKLLSDFEENYDKYLKFIEDIELDKYKILMLPKSINKDKIL